MGNLKIRQKYFMYKKRSNLVRKSLDYSKKVISLKNVIKAQGALTKYNERVFLAKYISN